MALDFSYSVSGLEASFRITSKVPADQVPVWDFGDDTGLVSGKNPVHTYEASGYYTVTLKLIEPTSDETGEGTEEEEVSTEPTEEVTEETQIETQSDEPEEETPTDEPEDDGTGDDTPEEEEEPVIPTGTEIAKREKLVIVSEFSKTHLTGSIYQLIDNYIPANLSISMTDDEKATYINKWQLYIQPLVNHEVPLEEYSNELYYEGLENQLVMELAAYDFLYIKIENMLIQTASQLNSQIQSASESEGEGEGRDRIKQITTGPTEVQYFDTVTESISTLFKSYADATKPGGILDDLRKNLCMLAQRMEIFLPFCTQPCTIKVPKVVNRRSAGPIGGPNPGSLIHVPKDSIL